MSDPIVVSTRPEDPEQPFEVEFIVKIKGYGKRAHQGKLVADAHQALCRGLHHADEDVQVYWSGKRVLVDSVLEDGEEPPGYVPVWKRVDDLTPAESEVDAFGRVHGLIEPRPGERVLPLLEGEERELTEMMEGFETETEMRGRRD